MQRPNPRTPRRPRHADLPPPDSLAYAMLEAAALVECVLEGMNLSDALQGLWRTRPDLPAQARGAIQDLVYGCLRDYGAGDCVLQVLLTKPAPPPVHALLLVAVHRLAVRPEDAHTIVDQAVRAVNVIAPGLSGLANAVLRNVGRRREALADALAASEVATLRHPAWWIRRVRTAYPDRWREVLEAGNTHPPMCLRVNLQRSSLEQAAARLASEGIATSVRGPTALLLERPLPVARIPGFTEGWYSVQDAGAQHAAEWLDLAAGQRVLDACAAPGGKAAAILERAPVELLALEFDPVRAQRIGENFDRLGLTGRIVVGDATRRTPWWDGRPFDRILADVPCSASGVVRRHPDIKWLRREDDIRRFARQQAQILDALWPALADGGKLLYVTCSVFPEENEEQVTQFCARHREAVRLTVDGSEGHQILPAPEHDGFFYALLAKNA